MTDDAMQEDDNVTRLSGSEGDGGQAALADPYGGHPAAGSPKSHGQWAQSSGAQSSGPAIDTAAGVWGPGGASTEYEGEEKEEVDPWKMADSNLEEARLSAGSALVADTAGQASSHGQGIAFGLPPSLPSQKRRPLNGSRQPFWKEPKRNRPFGAH